MVASNVMEKELQEITGVKKRSKEGKQKYLLRLLNAISDLPDDRWDDVSPEAQKWCNLGMKSLKKEEEIPDFSDEQVSSTGEDETEAKPVGKPTKKGIKGSVPATVGIKTRIKEMLIDNPKVRSTAIYDMLYKEGLRPSHHTVTGMRSEFRHTMRVLKSRGLLKTDD